MRVIAWTDLFGSFTDRTAFSTEEHTIVKVLLWAEMLVRDCRQSQLVLRIIADVIPSRPEAASHSSTFSRFMRN